MIRPNNAYSSMVDLFVPEGNTPAMPEDEDNKMKRTVTHDYHDHAKDHPSSGDVMKMQQDEEDSKKRRGPRGGVAQPFPEKLHLMLSSVERDGNSHIVSWQTHGRCFVVHRPKEFVSLVMPVYFRQTKLTSFQRQLNLYGFCRLTSGRDRGGYYHELFLRGRPFLCKRMMRTRIKGTGIKAASSPQTEPDFYLMPHVKNLIASSVSLEDVCMSPTHHQDEFSLPALVTPPAMVTPIHMPVEDPPELPFEIYLDPPQPDSLVEFEGCQFHYLDPASFSEQTEKRKAIGEWTADLFPLSDVVMV